MPNQAVVKIDNANVEPGGEFSTDVRATVENCSAYQIKLVWDPVYLSPKKEAFEEGMFLAGGFAIGPRWEEGAVYWAAMTLPIEGMDADNDLLATLGWEALAEGETFLEVDTGGGLDTDFASPDNRGIPVKIAGGHIMIGTGPMPEPPEPAVYEDLETLLLRHIGEDIGMQTVTSKTSWRAGPLLALEGGTMYFHKRGTNPQAIKLADAVYVKILMNRIPPGIPDTINWPESMKRLGDTKEIWVELRNETDMWGTVYGASEDAVFLMEDPSDLSPTITILPERHIVEFRPRKGGWTS